MRSPLRAYPAGMTVVGIVLTGCTGPRDTAPSPRDHGQAFTRTPPMGWNSWNSGIALTEHTVEQTIDAMVSSGMRDAGYRYVDLDAGWDATASMPARSTNVAATIPPLRH